MGSCTHMVKNKTANSVWLSNIKELLTNGQNCSPRGINTKEILGFTSKIDMKYPILSVKNRNISYGFMVAEAHWILSGSNLVEPLAAHAPKIRRFSDDGITFFGAYGPQIIPQIEYVVNSLTEDQDSRQAVVTIWQKNPKRSKDIPCTVSIQWLIRNNTLHCIDTMRSSDIWLGWPYDVFSFTMLTGLISIRLREKGINTNLGDFWLHAGSQHIYESNHSQAKICLDNSDELVYEPFDTNIFKSESELIDFLERRSLGKPTKERWMSEFFKK